MKTVIKTVTIPSWTYEGKEPGVLTFFESIALAGFEGQRIKLSAGIQQTLLGGVVFGRREITVLPEGTVKSSISVAFGKDYEEATWPASVISLALQEQKQLRPGTFGVHYYEYWNPSHA